MSIAAILLVSASTVLVAQSSNKDKSVIMNIKTPAFAPNGAIPQKYTCEGENISPALDWSGVPDKTRSLALIVDDPDAPNGDWVHFILFNIAPGTHHLPEHFKLETRPEPDMKAGTNSAGTLEYHGPCPPTGTHRYFFKIYALDIALDQPQGIRKQDLLSAMEGHVLARGEIIGTYHKVK